MNTFKLIPLTALVFIFATGCDTGDDDAEADGGNDDVAFEVPPDADELLPYLEAESYSGFAAESAVHPGTGSSPHGDVRVFINDTLDDSLGAGNDAHPVGSAAIKEIYSGDERAGWAVSVKTASDSAGGEGWYWYEILNDSVLADGNGAGSCTGCHDSTGVDFFSTDYPLQ